MKLPQCEINCAPAIFDSEILVVAGGRRPNENFFKAVAQGRKIFCVDKGIEICKDCNILPEILI